jgi:hypothetical protein
VKRATVHDFVSGLGTGGVALIGLLDPTTGFAGTITTWARSEAVASSVRRPIARDLTTGVFRWGARIFITWFLLNGMEICIFRQSNLTCLGKGTLH